MTLRTIKSCPRQLLVGHRRGRSDLLPSSLHQSGAVTRSYIGRQWGRRSLPAKFLEIPALLFRAGPTTRGANGSSRLAGVRGFEQSHRWKQSEAGWEERRRTGGAAKKEKNLKQPVCWYQRQRGFFKNKCRLTSERWNTRLSLKLGVIRWKSELWPRWEIKMGSEKVFKTIEMWTK